MNPTLPASLHHPLRHLWISLLLLAVPLAAEDPATTTMATDPRLIGDDLRIPDVFSTHLPQTLQSSGLRLFVHPHLGDFTSCDSLRTAAGLRYGLTENWEASSETEFYFSHGCGDVGLFDQSGFSSLAIGTKYDLGLHPFAPWHTAVGFDFNTPVSHPPADFTDGLRHYRPYTVSSRRLVSNPEIRLFWGAALDLVGHTGLAHEKKTNALDDHATALSAGAVWDHHAWHYIFEAEWASTRLLGRTQEDTLTLRPGVIWDVPWLRSSKNGRIVLLGAAFRANFGPDGTKLGLNAKVRINFDPKDPPRRRLPLKIFE